MTIIKYIKFVVIIVIVTIIFSCSKNEAGNSEYDPSLPISLTDFFPIQGGMATRMVIEGANFGTDLSQIKVFFNQKEASIVSVKNSIIYLLVPKLPGNDCVVTVKIGDQEAKFARNFQYIENYSVTTIAGRPGTNLFVEGSLATAQFGPVQHLTIDNENNLFITERTGSDGKGTCSVLNEESGTVTLLFKADDNLNVPTVNAQTQNVYIPLDGGYSFYELNPVNQWIAKKRLILHPSKEQQEEGMGDFSINWKHSLAFSRYDGMIYTRSYGGDLVKIDPETRVGQKVGNFFPNTDSFIVGHPTQPEILYIAYAAKHAIYTYNIETGEHKLFAGAYGQAGWNDGIATDAEFNAPRQMTLDMEGNIYVADSGNHCIRMIDKNGIVTTPIGKPGEAGYVDGSLDMALLNDPRGVAVDSEGDVYIADLGNSCIRKLTLQ